MFNWFVWIINYLSVEYDFLCPWDRTCHLVHRKYIFLKCILIWYTGKDLCQIYTLCWEWMISLILAAFGWQYIQSRLGKDSFRNYGCIMIFYLWSYHFECSQAYRVGLKYSSAGTAVTLDQVRALVWKASGCRYHLKTECERIRFHTTGFWVAYNNDEIKWTNTAGTFCLNSGNSFMHYFECRIMIHDVTVAFYNRYHFKCLYNKGHNACCHTFVSVSTFNTA